ncbi:MAG: hypothetical protein JXB46_04900 [Candidatus Eisenbacteria bacterium]|nr:hypothetical protein [Candidatus Eisenbacteria bacterium]
MQVRLTDLIARVPESVEERVKKTRDQMRSVVQDALRSECRLMFRTPQETLSKRAGAQVPIEISPGYPARLAQVEFDDSYRLALLLSKYRAHLEQMKAGANGLKRLPGELRELNPSEAPGREGAEWLSSVAHWAEQLLEILNNSDPLKRVLEVEEDILGVYKCWPDPLGEDEWSVNRASICIHWAVVGLVAEWMGCEVEDLTLIVLTHELAHAYTQLGADIEDRRWPASRFDQAETGLKEGLAQYYTQRVLERLEERHPRAIEVFHAMSGKQPEVYQVHIPWIENRSPESVRRAMLEVRRWQEGRLERFERWLEEAHADLHPEHLGSSQLELISTHRHRDK